jgi:nitrate/nitrite transporter NarK
MLAIVLITLCYTVQDLHMAALWSLTSDIGGRVAGTLAGNLNMLGNVGGLLGLWLVPKVIQIGSVHGEARWDNVFWMNGVVYLIGAAMWLRIDANEKLLAPGDVTHDRAEAT